jgi:hypothetical protein
MGFLVSVNGRSCGWEDRTAWLGESPRVTARQHLTDRTARLGESPRATARQHLTDRTAGLGIVFADTDGRCEAAHGAV